MRWETLTSYYGKFNQANIYQILSESASFCKRYDKKFGVFFGSQFQLLFTCKRRMISFTKYVIYLRWKGLHFCMTNVLRTICIKFYQNRLGFVEEMTSTFRRFFGSQCTSMLFCCCKLRMSTSIKDIDSLIG